MNQKDFQKLVDNFRDRPLENETWLENRADELMWLKNATLNFSQTIIGISGERGCGKTSLLNLFDAENAIKIILDIEEKENKFQIILDISQKLCEFVLREKLPREIKKYAQQFYEFTQNQETKLTSREYGIDVGAKWQGQEGKTLSLLINAGRDVLSRKFIYDTLQVSGLAKSSIADMLDKFIQKKVMESKNDSIFLDRKVKLYFQLFG